MDELRAYMLQWIARHPGKATGVGAGLVFGLLIALFGLIKAIVIVACVVIGYYFGARIDGDHGARWQ